MATPERRSLSRDSRGKVRTGVAAKGREFAAEDGRSSREQSIGDADGAIRRERKRQSRGGAAFQNESNGSDGGERSREWEYEAGVVDEAQEWYSCLALSGLVSSGLGMKLVPQACEFFDLSPETFASTGHQRFSWHLLQSNADPCRSPFQPPPLSPFHETHPVTSSIHVTSFLSASTLAKRTKSRRMQNHLAKNKLSNVPRALAACAQN